MARKNKTTAEMAHENAQHPDLQGDLPAVDYRMGYAYEGAEYEDAEMDRQRMKAIPAGFPEVAKNKGDSEKTLAQRQETERSWAEEVIGTEDEAEVTILVSALTSEQREALLGMRPGRSRSRMILDALPERIAMRLSSHGNRLRMRTDVERIIAEMVAEAAE